MKTLKKSLALLLSALMLFSTFAFVVANAEDENTRVTLDIRLDAPTAGKKAPEILPVEDKRFVPGDSELITLLSGDPEEIYERFGKVPTVEEYILWLPGFADGINKDKYVTAMASAFTQMIKNGIVWVEYDKTDIRTLLDAGVISDIEYSEYSGEYGIAPAIDELLLRSGEYGPPSRGINGREYATHARYMEPGESFKEGKSYICLCVAIADVKKETDEVKKSIEALMPYYEKKAVIDKKLETATGEETDKLENELAALREEYKDKYLDYEVKFGAAIGKIAETSGRDFFVPEITINGKKTSPDYDTFWASAYDFGEAEKAPTILDKIIEFFNTISEFFRNLFSSFKF